MPQQEMGYGDLHRDEADEAYTGYRSASPGGSLAGSYGQKVSPPVAQQGLTAGHRLALAIVSLLLWVGFFIVGIAVISMDTNGSATYDVAPLFIVGIVLFTVLVFFINYIFNRKQ